MRLKTLSGKLKYKNCKKYLIDWNKKQKSGYQTKTKNFLRGFWERDIVYTEFPVYGSKMTIDLFNASKMIAVEVQGEHHQGFLPFFSKNRAGFLDQIKRDMTKQKWCEDNKIELIEIFPEEIDKLSYSFFIEKFNLYL